MKYNKFIITRYKAIITPIIIDLTKKSLIPIIGINECGKTTILNAIFAFDYINDSYDSSIHHLTDVHNLYENSVDEAEIEAEIELTKNEFKECFSESLNDNQRKQSLKLKFPKNFNFPNTVIIKRKIGKTKSYSFNKEFNFLNNELQDQLCRQIVAQLPYILYFDDFRDSFPDRIEIPNEIKNTSSHWIQIIEELFKHTNKHYSVLKLPTLDTRQKRNVLSDVSQVLNNTLTKEWSNFRFEDREVLEIKIDLQNEDEKKELDKTGKYNFIPKKFFLTFEIVEKNNLGYARTFFVRDRSKGFFWFFNFVMKLEFNSKNLSNDENTIYLLDEPGSYLHTYAQQKLSKKLLSLSRNNKVLYCTHTHYLLDPEIIPLNTIHIAHKSLNSEIELYTSNDYPNKDSNLNSAYQPIFDPLGIRPFNLDFSYKNFLLVEGIFDFYSVSMFRTKNDYGIMPGRNADSLLNLISIMIGFSLKFKVLWDNDSEGQKNLEIAKKSFGTEFSKTHFFTLAEDTQKGKKILQNLYEGTDLKLIKGELNISSESSFTKSIATLFYSDVRDEILNKISSKTKDNFKNLLQRLNYE